MQCVKIKQAVVDGTVDSRDEKALGDSMDRADINDGDYVVSKKHEYGEDLDGKIVVVVINGMATIKEFQTLKNNMIGLFPQSNNTKHQPIYLDKSDQFLIAGVFRKILPVTYVAL